MGNHFFLFFSCYRPFRIVCRALIFLWKQKFFLLLLERRSKADWAWTCVQDLKELNISESLDEIKQTTKNKFSRIVKSRTRQNL